MRYLETSCPNAKVALTVVAVLLVAAAAGATHPGTWTAREDLPGERILTADAEVNGIIYTIGGWAGDGDQVFDTVFAFDPVTNDWTTKTNMPTPRGQAAAAVVDGKIYVIGGAIDTDFTASNMVEIYDPASDSWEAGTDMPAARWSPAAVAVDGKIYVIGGGTGDVLGDWSVYSGVQVYDPAGDSWDTAADMPTARANLSASVVDSRIYAVGGLSESGFSPKLEVYDPATDSWTIAADMPTPRGSLATATVDGKVYAIGGLASKGGNFASVAYEVEVYDPSNDSWEQSTRMPNARWGLGAAVVDDTIYLIGGGLTSTLGACNYVDTYDPNLYTSWTEVAAHLPGAHGSQWRTDVCAANFTGETANVELVLHADTDDVHQEYTIDPSEQKCFTDVVGNMGIQGKGTLEFRSDQPLYVVGRTFNDSGDGTFGQFCQFQTMDDGFFKGDMEVKLIGLRQEEGLFRTNMTFANTGIREATLLVSLYRCSGELLHTLMVANLMPGEVQQKLEPFAIEGGEPNLGWGYAQVKVVEGAGVRISASVIDSRTNDATTIVAER